MANINPKSVYAKTPKGVLEVKNKTARLTREEGTVFLLVDGKSTVADLLKKSGMAELRLHYALEKLTGDSFVKVFSSPVAAPGSPPATAATMAAVVPAGQTSGDDLDFTSPATMSKLNAEAAVRTRAEAEAKARALAAARAAAEAKIRQEAEARARAQAEARARTEGEAKLKADAAARAATEARIKAEAEAKAAANAKAKADAEARIKAATEARVRADMEAKTRAEAETRAKVEAASKAAAEAKSKLESQAKAEVDSRAHANVESRTKGTVEAQMTALQDALAQAEQRAEREAAERVRMETEIKARSEAEAKAEIQRQAREDAEANAEAERKARQEISIKIAAEKKARVEAERQAEFARKASEAMEAASSANLEAARRARAEAESIARKAEDAVAQARAMAEAERKARVAAEDRAKTETVARVMQEQQLRANSEGDIQARVQAEIKARDHAEMEADARYRQEAAARAKAAAGERRKREGETQAAGKGKAVAVKRSTNWAKVLGASLVALLAIAAGMLHVVPLNNYIGGAQSLISERLGVPVTISSIRYALLPSPQLTLERVGIGKLQEIKIETLVVSAWPMTLLADTQNIGSVEANNVVAGEDALALLPGWVKPHAGPLTVRRIQLKSVRISAKNIDVPSFGGDVTLGLDGALQRATFTDGKVRFELTPKDKALRVALDGRNWRPPLGPAVEFDDIAMEAVIEGRQARITGIDARIGRASIKGSANVTWSESGIRAEGDYSVTNGELAQLMAEFTRDFTASGTLNANVSFLLQGTTLQNVFAAPRMDASFNIEKGSLNNVDIVRAIQNPSREGLRGGKTGFNSLAGSLQVAQRNYSYRQLQLTSGPMNAKGSVDVGTNGELSGRIGVELGSKTVIVARGNLAVTGNLKTPVLRQ